MDQTHSAEGGRYMLNNLALALGPADTPCIPESEGSAGHSSALEFFAHLSFSKLVHKGDLFFFKGPFEVGEESVTEMG